MPPKTLSTNMCADLCLAAANNNGEKSLRGNLDSPRGTARGPVSRLNQGTRTRCPDGVESWICGGWLGKGAGGGGVLDSRLACVLAYDSQDELVCEF